MSIFPLSVSQSLAPVVDVQMRITAWRTLLPAPLPSLRVFVPGCLPHSQVNIFILLHPSQA